MGRITDGLVNQQPPVQSTEDISTKTTSESTDKAAATPKENLQTQTDNRLSSDSSTKVAEHSFNGQMQAAKLHAQIHHKPQEPEGKISQPAPKDAQKASKAPSMKEVMTNSGMKNVNDRPTDTELKTYYSTNAPAHDMIAKGNYKDAAAEYRKLAGASKNDGEKARLNMVAKQLDVAQTMSDAKVGDLSFPPTEANLQSYFGTMKGKPMRDIKTAYEDYSNAFYVHSETKGVDKGDVVYDQRTYSKDGKSFPSNAPDKWSDVSDRRMMHSDGRRIVDCEGFALIGEKCFKAAGFDQVEYAVMARMDDPKTPKNESYTDQHIMITARRTIQNPNGISAYEIGVISNGSFYSGSSYSGKTNYEQGRSQQVTNAYSDTFREYKGGKVQIPGGLVTYDGQAWISENQLMDLLKNPGRVKPK
jgi:hypothetical protein